MPVARPRRWIGRLLVVVLASLALHVALLWTAQQRLDFEQRPPPPELTVQAELFVLPKPIVIEEAAPRKSPPRRPARAITPPAAQPQPAAEPAADATPELPPEAPAEGMAGALETEAAPPPRAESAAEPRSTTESEFDLGLEEVVVGFPKYGRFVSDIVAARGLLRAVGTATTEWRVQKDSYTAMSDVVIDSGQTVLTLHSEGEVRSRSGIAPVRYTEKRYQRAEEATNFQWDTGKVTFSSTDAEFPLYQGAQDQLSFLAQLALLAEAFPDHFQPGGTIALQIAGRRDVRLYHMRMTGWEMITTPAGSFQTLKLERAVPAYERQTGVELWLAPSLRWLPARSRFTRSGWAIETNLRQVSFQEPPSQ